MLRNLHEQLPNFWTRCLRIVDRNMFTHVHGTQVPSKKLGGFVHFRPAQVRVFNTWAQERIKKKCVQPCCGLTITGSEAQRFFKLDPKSMMVLLLKMNPDLERPRVVAR